MAKEKFKYDPESNEEDNTAVLRLPFALCKEYGIKIEDWWTPRNAWEALRNGGYVDEPSDEMKQYFREMKKLRSKASNKARSERNKKKKQQLANPEHTPDENYVHEEGKIAGAEKGKPMTFEEADSGNVNPNFEKSGLIGYRHNCQTCVAVYLARRKGYDVRALPNLDNKNIYLLSTDVSLAYVDKNGNHPEKISKPHGMNTNAWLEKSLEQDKVYAIRFTYKGKRCGHIITVEKTSEGVKFYDPQTNTKYNDLSHYGSLENIQYMNINDCELDTEFCDSIMKSNKKQENSFTEINKKRMGK